MTLHPKAEKSLSRRHPWIFSNAVQSMDESPEQGETVMIQNKHGQALGFGAYSPHSQIRVRMWTFDPEETVDDTFFRERLHRALVHRASLMEVAGSAIRWVNGESDGLPGLIVDKYDTWLVCQFLSAGAHAWKSTIVSCLAELFPASGIYERTDSDVLDKEGLPKQTGVLWGKEPPDLIDINEGGLRFLVNVREGHKTGFYLDQRDNRKKLSEYTHGKRVLNCFSYTGGFSLWALKGGATRVTSIDISKDAVALLEKNVHQNGMDAEKMVLRCDDVFKALRTFRDSRDTFDVIVLDPPKFASSAQTVNKAARGYKDINLLAMKLLSPGGILFTFSCSGHIMPPLFQKIVSDAAVDAGRDARIIHQMTQAEDHPVSLAFPEGLYLKGLVIRVD